VPDEPLTSQLNDESLDAFLQGVLEELKHPQDPRLLEKVRKAF